MYEQLKNVYIIPAKIIRLRFNYHLPNKQSKVLVYTLEMKHIVSENLTVYSFLMSVMEQLLSPFLLMQHEYVNWDTVSITYPLRKDNKYDLLKLPLQNITRQIESEESFNMLKHISISVRFKQHPMPMNVKIFGIETQGHNPELINEWLNTCSAIYERSFMVPETGVSYRIIFINQYKASGLEKKQPIMAFSTIK